MLRTLVLIAALAAVCHAGDEWPQFRGSTGQGIVTAADLPLTWSETENVRWKTAIPGQGWSSPVISGTQIWMTTALNNGKSLHAVCVDLNSGKTLHDIEVFQVEAPQNKNALNSYASPSPVIEGNRVYVHFGNDGTACLDTTTAQIVWQNREMKLNHSMGAGSSPILHKEKLIFCCDGTDVQYVAALDKQTGKAAWKTKRSQPLTRPPEFRKAFCTPLVITVGGKDQVIAPGAEYLYAYDPESGKELWFLRYAGGYSNAPRPVYGLGMLFICTGFDKPECWAVRPEGSGELGPGSVVWKLKTQVPLQPSPLLAGERLFLVNDKGTATCLDARTGRELWRQPLGGEFSASPLYAAGRIYVSDRTGITTVIEDADAYKVLARNTLADGCMASAAVIGKALILRTKQNLYRIEK